MGLAAELRAELDRRAAAGRQRRLVQEFDVKTNQNDVKMTSKRPQNASENREFYLHLPAPALPEREDQLERLEPHGRRLTN